MPPGGAVEVHALAPCVLLEDSREVAYSFLSRVESRAELLETCNDSLMNASRGPEKVLR